MLLPDRLVESTERPLIKHFSIGTTLKLQEIIDRQLYYFNPDPAFVCGQCGSDNTTTQKDLGVVTLKSPVTKARLFLHLCDNCHQGYIEAVAIE